MSYLTFTKNLTNMGDLDNIAIAKTPEVTIFRKQLCFIDCGIHQQWNYFWSNGVKFKTDKVGIIKLDVNKKIIATTMIDL